MTASADLTGSETEPRNGPVKSEPDARSLQERVAALHDRLHLKDVRIQRMLGEVLADPPLAVESVSVSVAAPEALVESPRLACRFTERVALLGQDDERLAVVEIVIVLEFALDGQDEPDAEAVAVYVDRNAYFIAHPYLREAVQTTTARLGLDPVVLGVLGRDEDRLSELTLVRRAEI